MAEQPTGEVREFATIYGLCEPETGAVRYVGQTTRSPVKRRGGHIRGAKRGGHFRVCHWIRKLLREGREPELVILETCSREDANAREQHWIAELRRESARLMNATPGGSGGGFGGHQHSEQTKQLISELHRDKPLTSQHRERISRSKQGVARSPEFSAHMSRVAKDRGYATRLNAARRRLDVSEIARKGWRTRRARARAAA